jgi:hypothetical protein
MTGGWIPRRATGLIPGSRGRKTMQGQFVDRMRGRPLLLAEAFGIGPGEAGLGGGRIRGCCLSLPTAAQQAEGARRPGSENLAELQAALNEARGLDRSGKESDCMDAVQRAKRLAG